MCCERNTIFDKLPKPNDYFTGSGTTFPWIPENILVFSRKTFYELQPKNNSNFHYRFSININLGSPQQILVDRHSFEIGKDMVLVVFPHQYHRFIETDGEVRMIFITFEASASAFIAKLRDQVVHMSGETLHWVEKVCTTYTHLSSKVDEEKLQLQLGLFMHMLVSAMPSSPVQLESDGLLVPENILKACNLISANPHISISDLSKECAVSEGYLRYRFKQLIGISLGRSCIDITIHKAKRLLATTTLSVGQVGEYCGYDSSYSFSRMFSRETGTSPKNFRMMQRQPSNRYHEESPHNPRNPSSQSDIPGQITES